MDLTVIDLVVGQNDPQQPLDLLSAEAKLQRKN
jgi:hypothetical protein